MGAAHVLEPPTDIEQSQGVTRVLLMVMEPPRVPLMKWSRPVSAAD